MPTSIAPTTPVVEDAAAKGKSRKSGSPQAEAATVVQPKKGLQFQNNFLRGVLSIDQSIVAYLNLHINNSVQSERLENLTIERLINLIWRKSKGEPFSKTTMVNNNWVPKVTSQVSPLSFLSLFYCGCY
jgi:hypothetical protein